MNKRNCNHKIELLIILSQLENKSNFQTAEQRIKILIEFVAHYVGPPSFC